MALEDYRRKRDFAKTPEPGGGEAESAATKKTVLSFVVQMHAARQLHYDFRLESGGVLKSWAVPKGPSLNPADKRLAMHVEDHPMEYGGFEGVIPEGNYGAGRVIVWDRGTWEAEGSAGVEEQYRRGDLKFRLTGQKLNGSFALVKIKGSRAGSRGNEWLLIKHKDAFASPEWNAADHARSVITGRTLDEVTDGEAPAPASAAEVAGALRAKGLPEFVEPMLATLSEAPFDSPDWLFEIKWDGMRISARIADGTVVLRSRTGRVVTGQFPELAILPERFPLREALLDGEVVVLDEEGQADFARLQPRMQSASPTASMMASAPVALYLFDILFADGYDLRGATLLDRKRMLRRMLLACPPVRYADHVVGAGRAFFELVSARGMEGMVGKKCSSTYESGRARSWLKFKNVRELDAVVGGFTAPRGGREHFGALLLGLYEKGGLRFIGGVGTGFDSTSQARTAERLSAFITNRCPFPTVPQTKEKATWLKPEAVARIKYLEFTPEGHLRGPVFLGLRDDLDPEDCQWGEEGDGASVVSPKEELEPERAARTITEIAVQRGPKTVPLEHALIESTKNEHFVEVDRRVLRFTNLNKVYFPEPGYTKRQLLGHYTRVAPYLLRFLAGRPLVLHRFPNGLLGKPFYQKDMREIAPEWMRTSKVWSEHAQREIELAIADDLAGVLFLTNLGCIEHNPLPTLATQQDRPDYLFFDLDPVEDTPWESTLTVAREFHRLLKSAGIPTYMKTSGASGFHIFVPLKALHTFEQVRLFTEIVSQAVHGRLPKLTTLERAVGKRPSGTVYLDYTQNAQGRPLASVYSVRPQPAATVSWPVSGEQLAKGISPGDFHLGNAAEWLRSSGLLWMDFFEHRVGLEEALERFENVLTPKPQPKRKPARTKTSK